MKISTIKKDNDSMIAGLTNNNALLVDQIKNENT